MTRATATLDPRVDQDRPQVYTVRSGSVCFEQGFYVLHLQTEREGIGRRISLRLTDSGAQQLADALNGALSA